jgi:transposase InsO family protein
MTDLHKLCTHERWAHLRFSVVGPLLAAPPASGELRAQIQELAAKTWLHPVTGKPIRFGFSTIERWYHKARGAKTDPVGVLRRRLRSDSGQQPTLGETLRAALLAQYAAHKSWSLRLHYDNLSAHVEADPQVGPLPSYSTVHRYFKANGLFRRRRRITADDPASKHRAQDRLDEREVRSYEAEYVHGLWHLDFHHGSRQVLTPAGEWVTPQVLGVLDDRSRLACHVQWYLSETAEDLIHALSQAFQKRALPRALLTDNGSAMIASETTQGLARLGVLHKTTLPYSPYQNGKQENFWAQLEGRLMAMLDGVRDLTLPVLNEATQAWAEMEYHRRVHSEIGQTPLERYLAGPEVGRPSPGSDALRLAFTTEERRTQRRSDGTISLLGRRFEIPATYRALTRPVVRYATWDLTYVYLVDERTGAVLTRIYPLDKVGHADGRRRRLTTGPLSGLETLPCTAPAMAPLLRQLMAEYAATGLPPAYLPKEQPEPPETLDPGTAISKEETP